MAAISNEQIYEIPRNRRSHDPGRALFYVLGMAWGTVTGTAFVAGGLLAEARGLAAVALAAALPVAGLLWAVTLSYLHREQGLVRRPDGDRVAGELDR